MSFHHAFAALTIFALVTTVASAQEDTPEEQVIVRAQRVGEAVSAFVGAITVEPGNGDQVARWDRRVCVGVIGVAPRQAQAIVDRVSLRALEVGLDVGAPNCGPNVLVIFTPESDRVARDLVLEHRTQLGYYGDGNTRGRAALTEFAETPRPVRWWHVSQTAEDSGFATRESANAGEPPPSVPVPGSRIRRATQQVFFRVVIIVDTNRTDGATVGGLADYVSMVALAQLDPSADTSAWPTILNAFRGGAPLESVALTEWDLAYLAWLYRGPNDTRASLQRRAIEQSILDDQ